MDTGHVMTTEDSEPSPTELEPSSLARLVVVSNRIGSRSVQTGGLATALQGALEEHGGQWFGWSGRVLDEGEPARVATTPGHVRYTTLDLHRSEYQGFYCNFANRVLWPLFHFRPDLVDYSRADYEAYLAVNQRFAELLIPTLQPDDTLWIHDYHLIPLAGLLRQAGVTQRIGFFLHTPLAPAALLAMLPSHEQLFGSLQHYDLVGLQRRSDRDSLQDYFIRELGARTRPGGVLQMPGGHRFEADVFAISIDTEVIARQSRAALGRSTLRRLRQTLQDRALIIGVDRLDYSKGLPIRFNAYGELLEQNPSLRRRVTLLQIAPPSRSEVPEYQELRLTLEQIAGHINGLYAEPDWMPIHYLNRSFSQRLLTGFYRMARVALVTPLRDGMNLVAKEYIASQDPEDPGVLILSRFAGAAAELDQAVLVNPLDGRALSEAMHHALAMPLEERQQRWQHMVQRLRRHDIHHWTRTFIGRLRAARRGAVSG